MRRAYDAGLTLLYGASKLESIFYVLEREATRAARLADAEDDVGAAGARAFAWGCIENIRELATAVGVDEADLWLAGKYRAVDSDLEDNVLLAAAQRCSAECLVTWDRVLLANPVVRVATPTQMCALLDMSASDGS